jgi:hypothetical protein
VRFSDAEFCSPSKIENSRVNWGSNHVSGKEK